METLSGYVGGIWMLLLKTNIYDSLDAKCSLSNGESAAYTLSLLADYPPVSTVICLSVAVTFHH